MDLGIAVGASGLGGFLAVSDSAATNGHDDIVPFYGPHQAGIATKPQDNLYFVSLEVTTDSKSDLIQLFKEWTRSAALMTEGKIVGDTSSNANLPPKDTGEAVGLSPSNLTITFGVGPSLFKKNGRDRFGLRSKQPAELVDLPKFPFDALKDEWNGGDLCIQACADDLQVAFHAVRNLVRIAQRKSGYSLGTNRFSTYKASGLEKSYTT